MGVQNFFDSCKDIANKGDGQLVLYWSKKGVGFGQYFIYTDDDGFIHIDSECMNRESVKKIVCMMIDQAIFDDEVEISNEVV